jgi:general stress protein YciG
MSSISESQQVRPQDTQPTTVAVRPDHGATAPREEQELTPDGPPSRAGSGATQARRPRGFAAIDRKLLAEIASKGGKAAHTAGTAHEFTSDEARAAGRKGGLATHAKRRKIEP